METRRSLFSTEFEGLVHTGLTNWVTSRPSTSPRITPAAFARSITRSKAESIRSPRESAWQGSSRRPAEARSEVSAWSWHNA